MMVFKDHHIYSIEDMKAIRNTALKNNTELIITTEKDWVKIASIVRSDPSWHYLRIDLQLENESLLEKAFHRFF